MMYTKTGALHSKAKQSGGNQQQYNLQGVKNVITNLRLYICEKGIK